MINFTEIVNYMDSSSDSDGIKCYIIMQIKSNAILIKQKVFLVLIMS